MTIITGYRSWPQIDINYLHINAINPTDIEKIKLRESEVFYVHMLERDKNNCWYENNFDIALYASSKFLNSASHLRFLKLNDAVPEAFQIIVPPSMKSEVQSASYAVKSTFQLENSSIAISLMDLPVLPAPILIPDLVA